MAKDDVIVFNGVVEDKLPNKCFVFGWKTDMKF